MRTMKKIDEMDLEVLLLRKQLKDKEAEVIKKKAKFYKVKESEVIQKEQLVKLKGARKSKYILSVTTPDIYCCDVNLGKYIIRFHYPDTDSSYVTIRSKIKRQYEDHPHVSGGNACFGGFGKGIFNAVQEKRWYDAYVLIIQFLEATPANGHTRPEDIVIGYCNKCGERKDRCRCKK